MRLVNAASPRNIDQKYRSETGTQGIQLHKFFNKLHTHMVDKVENSFVRIKVGLPLTETGGQLG